MHMIGVSSIDCCTADFSTRGQVRSWLFVSSASILRTLRAIFLSNAALAFILKQTELTDEVFSNPSALPISLCLCPPTLRHKYIAIDRASFCSPRRFLLNSSKGLPYALAVTRAICSTPIFPSSIRAAERRLRQNLHSQSTARRQAAGRRFDGA